MRKIVTVAALIGILIALPVVQAMAAEQKPGVPKQPSRVKPPAATTPPLPPATGAQPAPTVIPPGLTAPPATTNAPGKPPRPPLTGNLPTAHRHITPTENLSNVADAIQVQAKSLTTWVTVPPGLALTQPVTISIGFGGYGHTRITQTYVPSTGNRFVYNDPEGDGKPRSALVDITLSEPKPGGGVYSYPMPGNVMLDPLYDVKIDPLQFTLQSDCGTIVGHTNIRLLWVDPDWVDPDGGWKHLLKFSTDGDKTSTIFEFAWSGAEVSASMNKHFPSIGFWVWSWSPPGGDFTPGWWPDTTPPLVPGKTQTVKGSLRALATFSALGESSLAGGPCYALTQYTINYHLVDPFKREH